jgi:hypothetical protein
MSAPNEQRSFRQRAGELDLFPRTPSLVTSPGGLRRRSKRRMRPRPVWVPPVKPLNVGVSPVNCPELCETTANPTIPPGFPVSEATPPVSFPVFSATPLRKHPDQRLK